MNILYVVFGEKRAYHTEAVFSILSLLGQLKKEDRIIVVSDYPDNYRFLEDRIIVKPLSREKVQEWRGPHDFLWRVKIKALMAITEEFSGQDIMYLDGDTFLYGDLNNIKTLLQNGKNLMHLPEGPLKDIHGKTTKIMRKQINGKFFGGIKMDDDKMMWNAGVVAISARHTQSALELALNICDEMCAQNVRRRLIEQFALSIGLQTTSEMFPAKNEIGHYWGNKDDWDALAESILLQGFFQKKSIEDLTKQVNQLDFKALPVYVKRSDTKAKLIKFLNNLFPDKKILHLTDV